MKRPTVNIPWDLEGTPLQIKTDSTPGSDERIRVGMYGTGNTGLGAIAVRFSSPIRYWIGYCMNDPTDLPVQPPEEVDMIWTIIKTETAIIVRCNDVEVLNYRFADSSLGTCVSTKQGDVVEKIAFVKSNKELDTASDFYRPFYRASGNRSEPREPLVNYNL